MTTRPLGFGDWQRVARMVTACLAACIWVLVPLSLGHRGRVPHTHVLIGAVTSVDMALHLAEEKAQAELTHTGPDVPRWQGGRILSVPFGNPAAFFAFLFTVAPVVFTILRPHTIAHGLLQIGFLVERDYLPIPNPPPRAPAH